MKVLIACEESQEVCKTFRAKGHDAYSHNHADRYRGMFTRDRAKNRSKTFTGIALAMAEQRG